MNKLAKQSGKALCYTLLFGGMQVVATFIMTAIISAQIAAELISLGIQPKEEEISQRLMEGIQNNMAGIQILSYILILVGTWTFFRIRRKKLLVEANIVAFEKNRILPVIILAISAVFTVDLFFSLFPQELLLEYESAVQSLLGGNAAVVLLSTVVGAPIVEEIIFRGLVFSRLRKAMPMTVAAILSSIVFGLYHGQIIWICYAVCLGLVMCFIVVNCRSVLASLLFHVVFNFFGSTPLLVALLGENPLIMMLIRVGAMIIFILSLVWLGRLSRKEKRME